jgi:DNA-binding winged helix-turn-helix (wHTH) protein/tetratricopeptide (TPR) repeat protein
VIFRFDNFELDTALFELRKDGAACAMEPQVFEVLSFLVQNHDRLVSKDELLDHVWPERYITEAALNSRLMAARKVLGDSGKEQRYIKTVHGRGYRFIGSVARPDEATVAAKPVTTAVDGASPPAAVTPAPVTIGAPAAELPLLVGREDERRQLLDAMQATLGGRRQVVFLSGEAGIGKTTLVDHFAASVHREGLALVARGQCIDYRGAAEAYMPVLEALGQLVASASDSRLRELLAERAPSWLSQLPWLLTSDELRTLQERTVGATRERMLREMLEFLDALTAATPLVLILEDVHWADFATLDLIDALARRQASSRLLVLATYRPADVHARNHPLASVERELRARGYAREIALSYLSLDDVESLLLDRFPGCDCPGDLAAMLHARTHGNPFFVASVLDGWESRGALVRDGDGWTMRVPLDDLTAGLPDQLRDVIVLQIEQVEAPVREMLASASVAGLEFAAVAVAAGVRSADDEVERQLADLARRGILIEARGTAEFPDGSVCGRFAFVHELYLDVLYDDLPPGTLSRMHREIGVRLESAYGPESPEHGAELAMHFLRGRDLPKAAGYFGHAATQAMARGAAQEALQHIEAALKALEQAPSESPDQAFEALRLHMMLPATVLATRGFADPRVEEAYLDALDLASRLGDEKARANLTYSLAAVYEYRGQHQKAYELLGSASPETTPGDRLSVEYHALLSCTHFHRGGFELTVDHADHGLLLDKDATSDPRYAVLGEDPGVGCNEWSSLALWFLGYPDRALERAREAVRLASVPARAYSRASAQTHVARVHQLRGEADRALEVASDTVQLATECGFLYHTAVATIVEGWAMAMLGRAEGLARLAEGIALHRANGADMDRSYFLALQGEALFAAGQLDAAGAVLQEAVEALPPGSTYYYEAEIQRLLGELASRRGSADAGDASQHWHRALQIAKDQAARSLELRVATNLARLAHENGDPATARQLVEPVLDWFTEGFDTRDLQAARALLDELPVA